MVEFLSAAMVDSVCRYLKVGDNEDDIYISLVNIRVPQFFLLKRRP